MKFTERKRLNLCETILHQAERKWALKGLLFLPFRRSPAFLWVALHIGSPHCWLLKVILLLDKSNNGVHMRLQQVTWYSCCHDECGLETENMYRTYFGSVPKPNKILLGMFMMQEWCRNDAVMWSCIDWSWSVLQPTEKRWWDMLLPTGKSKWFRK